MKKIFLLLFTVLLISCHKEQKPKTIVKYIKVKEETTKDSVNKKFDCYDGSQLEMNICSADELNYYDSILNVKYQKTINYLNIEIEKEKKFNENYYFNLKTELVQSQRNWIKLKENNREVYEKYYDGGSIRPLAKNIQSIKDTKDRIKFLEDFDSN